MMYAYRIEALGRRERSGSMLDPRVLCVNIGQIRRGRYACGGYTACFEIAMNWSNIEKTDRSDKTAWMPKRKAFYTIVI